MKPVRVGMWIGLAIGVVPAFAVHLMPRIAMLDRLGPVILGFILGMQAASRRPRHGRHLPARTAGTTARPR